MAITSTIAPTAATDPIHYRTKPMNTEKPFRPMLALDVKKLKTDLAFPLYGSPKLDGVRCLIINGVPTSRTLKPLPNRHLAAWTHWAAIEGLDGELIIGDPTAPDAYNRTTSAVMSHDAPLDGLRFWVFDCFADPTAPYSQRLATATLLTELLPDSEASAAIMLPQILIEDDEQLREHEARVVEQGYEGLMLRSPATAYKFGRTASKGAELLKVKRFEDSEAEIIECHPLMRNGNAAETSELGLTKRSTHAANMVADELLGALSVRDIKTGIQFSIGSGFDQAAREAMWKGRDALPGQLVKYKFQPAGVKEAPRFPVYLGMRSPIDL